jgi:WD40 repeat protein
MCNTWNRSTANSSRIPAGVPHSSTRTYASQPAGRTSDRPHQRCARVALSPDGHTLASGDLEFTVRLWNVTDPAHPSPLGQPLIGHTDTVFAVAFSPDGHTLATGSADHTVRLSEMEYRPSNPTDLRHHHETPSPPRSGSNTSQRIFPITHRARDDLPSQHGHPAGSVWFRFVPYPPAGAVGACVGR